MHQKSLLFWLFISFFIHLIALGSIGLVIQMNEQKFAKYEGQNRNLAEVNIMFTEQKNIYLKNRKNPDIFFYHSETQSFVTQSNLLDLGYSGETGSNSGALSSGGDEEGIGIYSAGEVDTLPIPTTDIYPEYPLEARIKGIEGSVVLDVIIDEAGEVKDIEVVEGEKIFVEECVKVLRKAKFIPAKKRNIPVPVKIRIPYKFILKS